jgi:hypothetical protein
MVKDALTETAGVVMQQLGVKIQQSTRGESQEPKENDNDD